MTEPLAPAIPSFRPKASHDGRDDPAGAARNADDAGDDAGGGAGRQEIPKMSNGCRNNARKYGARRVLNRNGNETRKIF